MAVRPTVYYVGAFQFPDGDAAAARVLGIGKALREVGAAVIFGGWERFGRLEDQTSGHHEYQGFRYVSQAELRHEPLPLVKRALRQVSVGRRTLRWLRQQPLRPRDVVIAYGGGISFLSRLFLWSRTSKVRLLVDCTEWYDPGQLPWGRLGVPWWDSQICLRALNPHVGRLIVISRFLEEYYQKRGCAVLRVPPLVDLEDVQWRRPPLQGLQSGPLRLVYAGSPGRKDLVGNVLQGMAILHGEGRTALLQLIGPERDWFERSVPEWRALPQAVRENITFGGRVPQSDVPARLAEADFSVLLRPQKRYAQAGFPTKVVESLAAGVPVMTNPTSDIAQYVRDGVEGILLEGHTATAFAAGVRRVLQGSRATWAAMRPLARLQAQASFDFRPHAAAIGDFVLGTQPDHRSPKPGSAAYGAGRCA